MRSNTVPYFPLKRELELIALDGGVDASLYNAVKNWRATVLENGGKPLESFGETLPEDLVENILPLLIGIDDAETKARRYFIDQEATEKIGDEVFARRARLWERMMTPYQTDGLLMPDGQVVQDVALVVMTVLLELKPEIRRELGQGFDEGDMTTI